MDNTTIQVYNVDNTTIQVYNVDNTTIQVYTLQFSDDQVVMTRNKALRTSEVKRLMSFLKEN